MAIGTAWAAIDSDVASNDWQTSTLLPHLLRRNLLKAIEETHIQGTHAYAQWTRGSGASTLEPPILSTHPNEWWEIPIIVPQQYGAEDLALQLYAEVQAASGATAGSVDLRVVLEGVEGSDITLTEAAGKHLTTEVTVPCPQVTNPNGYWRGAIQFRSAELATLESGADLLRTIGRHDMIIESIATAAAYATGRGDRLIRVTSLGTTTAGNAPGDISQIQTDYYCGYVDLQYPVEGSAQANAARFVVWPEVDPALQAHDSANNNTGGTKITDAVDIIELGAVQLFGYRWRFTGARDYGLWSNSTMRPGRPMAATQLLNGVDAAMGKLYRNRVQVFACGPDDGRGNSVTDVRDQYWHGARFGAGSSAVFEEVAGRTVVCREDVIGWTITVAWLGVPGQEDESVTWRVSATFPSSTPSTDYETTGTATPRLHAEGDPANGYLTGFNIRMNPEFWSAIDLGRDGEYARLNVSSFPLPINANIAPGDEGSIQLLTDADVWVGAVLITEKLQRDGVG